MRELKVKAILENLSLVNEFLDEVLSDLNCNAKSQMQIELVTEEIFVNIVNYAYTPNIGMATIQTESDGNELTIRFIDSGIAYNPLEKEKPDISLPVDKRQVGGLGIFLVREIVNDMIYERKNDQNILTIKKKI